MSGMAIGTPASAASSDSRILHLTPSRPAIDLVSGVVFSQPAGALAPHVLLKMDVLGPRGDAPLPAVVFAPEALWVNGVALFGVGGAIEDHPEAATAANPLHYVTENAPPSC